MFTPSYMAFFPFQKLLERPVATELILPRHRVFDLDYVDEHHNTAKNKLLWRRFFENSPNESEIWTFAVSHPVPSQYRARLWREGHIKFYANAAYTNELKMAISTQEMSAIRTDILRTPWLVLPADLKMLREILVTFVHVNPQVGYFQGLNLVAAVPMLVGLSKDEIVSILHGFFTGPVTRGPAGNRELSTFGEQIRATQTMLRKLFPKTHQLLEFHGIDLTVLGFDGYLSCFSSIMPLFAVLRIWDFCLLGPFACFSLNSSIPHPAAASCLIALIECNFIPILIAQSKNCLSAYFADLRSITEDAITRVLRVALGNIWRIREELERIVYDYSSQSN